MERNPGNSRSLPRKADLATPPSWLHIDTKGVDVGVYMQMLRSGDMLTVCGELLCGLGGMGEVLVVVGVVWW